MKYIFYYFIMLNDINPTPNYNDAITTHTATVISCQYYLLYYVNIILYNAINEMLDDNVFHYRYGLFRNLFQERRWTMKME